MKTSTSLEEYISLLGIRKKYALISSWVSGAGAVVLFACAFGIVVVSKNQLSPLYVLLIVTMVTAPLIGLIGVDTEYRRLKGILELLSVLQQADGENLPEDNLPKQSKP